jgi:hypothetical protein
VTKFLICDDIKFLGCGVNDDFIMEKVRSCRVNHVVVLQQVDDHVNIYEMPQGCVAAAPAMHAALNLIYAEPKRFTGKELIAIGIALARAEGG